MERRYDSRFGKSIKVLMHVKGNNLLNGRTNDISKNGMFVEMEPQETMQRGAVVRLAFKSELGLHIVHSLIVRTESNGVALMFARMNDRIAIGLGRLLASDADEEDVAGICPASITAGKDPLTATTLV